MACQFFYFNFSLWSIFMQKKISYQIVLIINALEIFPILFIEIHRFYFFQKNVRDFFFYLLIFFLNPRDDNA